MKLERAIDIKMEMETRIHDLISLARVCGFTSSELHNKSVELFNKYPKDLPQWVRWYCNGYFEALERVMHDTETEFCYTVNGKRYSIRKESPIYYGNKISPKELHDKQENSGRYWIKSGKLYY
jgi:hypothetical protein